MRRRTAYNENDDDLEQHQHHNDHVPLANSESAAAATSTARTTTAPTVKWTDQLGIYLQIMAKNKKQSQKPEVAAYYKKQREVLKRLIEVHELQDQDHNDPSNNNNEGGGTSAVVPSASSATGVIVPSSSSSSSAGGALAGTPIEDNVNGSAAAAKEPTTEPSTSDAVVQEEDDEDEEGGLPATLSLILNICLLGIKVYAAIASGSLIVFASLLDSALDLLSGVILVYVEHKVIAAQNDPDYPLGSHYFESVGTLIFSSFMFVASTRLVEDGITSLIDINGLSVDITLPTLVVMGAVVVTKFIAWILCRTSPSSIVQALAQDHFNDVCTNIVGLAGLFLTQHVSKYFDPVISLLSCGYLMRTWGTNILEQAHAMSGKMADRDYLNEITSLARNCDDRILGVDKVWAVLGGSGFIVEVDLVLDPETPLKVSHDIGERFQMFLEKHKTLNVSRAYVHLDWETDHDARRHQ